MEPKHMKRRDFLQASMGGAAAYALSGAMRTGPTIATAAAEPALAGGEAVRTASFPGWPVFEDNDAEAWKEVLEARNWFRFNGGAVSAFEERYAELMGSRHCLATANGTSALYASLNALEVGPGDEVIVPPYTFEATINVVLLQFALPIFVDTDRESMQIDAGKIEDAITENTRCIMPVHLGGLPADMDTILEVAERHDIPVIEDACQAHMAEWRGQKVGSLGDTGCFSFQVTKNLPSGEGGAMLTNRDDLMERAFAFHSNGRAWGQASAPSNSYNGANLRMTEFQGALLQAQMERLEEQSQTRESNAAYLTERLEEIPGITPAQMYEGATRNGYHLYMFRYDGEAFQGLGRNRFMQALRAEGIPCSGGYSPQYDRPYVRDGLYSRGYLNIYGRERIDRYFDELHCPENDQLCTEAVWFTQPMLLGPQSDMDDIADAIEKIRDHAETLKDA